MVELACILLVDDSEADHFLHRMVIEEAGYADRVQTAEHGEAALEYLERALRGAAPWPELIVIDINMPRMDGWQFLDRCLERSLLPDPRTTVAMVSTSLDPKDEARARAYSCVDDYLSKPLTDSALERILERRPSPPGAVADRAAPPAPRSAFGSSPGPAAGVVGDPPRETGTRVLLVEDDRFDAEFLEAKLEIGRDEPLQLHVVGTLCEAVALAERDPFDAVLLDLSLPDSRGLQTLDRMRSAIPHVAIIVMTGNLDDRMAARAVEHGADAYFVKGEAEPSLLVRTILYAAQRRSAMNELEAERQRIEHKATHDSLTGLPNRALFADRLEQAIETCFRTGRVVGLLFVDLDGFKAVNDTLGHAAGDALLEHVARQLEDQVRSSDTVARLAGDEFVVLLTNVRRAGDVETLALKIEEALSDPVEIGSQRLEPSASIGVAVAPRDGSTVEDLLAASDASMYTRKSAKRGRAHRTDPLQARRAVRSRPFQSQSLETLYRPRFSVRSGCTAGFDVQLRADVELRPGLSGRGLLTFAEQHGFGDALWKAFLERLGQELAEHAPLRQTSRLSIPLVASQLLRTDFDPQLPGAQLPAGPEVELCVPAGLLAQEIERDAAALGPLSRTRRRLVLDHEEGFDLALPALRHLKPDGMRLHVDRLGDFEKDRLDSAALFAFSQFMERLQLPWGVVGVESPEQAHLFVDLGCREMQGPLFGEFIPAEALGAQLDVPRWRPGS